MGTYNVREATIAQYDYCNKKGYPHFAPRGGLCYRCGKNIYEKREYKAYGRTYTSGITVDKAGSELVTGCPHCNISYCD